MGIQLVTSSPFSSPVALGYSSSGVYVGSIEFQAINLGLSSVSSVNLQTLTLASSSNRPNVVFALSGVTLPQTLIMDAITNTTPTIWYTITANNNYLHASTEYAHLTSRLVATAALSANTTIGGETSAMDQSFFSGVINAAGDTASPSPVSSLQAVGGDRVITLTWNNPVEVDWVSTTIEQSIVAPVTAIGLGAVVYTGALSTVAVSVPVNGTEVYYFGAYTTDNVSKNSTVVTVTPNASAVPTWYVWTSEAEHARRYIQDEL